MHAGMAVRHATQIVHAIADLTLLRQEGWCHQQSLIPTPMQGLPAQHLNLCKLNPGLTYVISPALLARPPRPTPKLMLVEPVLSIVYLYHQRHPSLLHPIPFVLNLKAELDVDLIL
eukprot:747317-Pelagomonas_calceolata.AAC.1